MTGRTTAKSAGGSARSLCNELNEIHVFRLQAFGPFLDFERYASALVKRTVSAGRDGRKMDEDIFATFALDKSKSFGGIKPLNCSGFFQNDSFCDLTPAVSIEGGWANGIQRTHEDDYRFSLAVRRAAWLL